MFSCSAFTSILQIQKFQIQEMELSFTQGRWNYNQWGGVDPVTRLNAKPSGVELWAKFAVPDREINSNWGNLTHALSGLFCASLNFLESPLMTANPVRAFKRKKKEATFGAPELREKEYLSPSSSSSSMPVYIMTEMMFFIHASTTFVSYPSSSSW